MKMLITSLLCVLFFSTFSIGQTIYVKADASGANNGTSWADAYTDLQSALPQATATKPIWVAAGTYHPHASDRTVSFNILTGTKLYGGFNGTETLLTESDPTNNITILSGDLAGNDNSTLLNTEPTRQDNSYQIVAIKGLNMSGIVISGFTITGGNANGTLSTAGGASVQYNRERGAAIATQSFSIGTTISAAIQKCIIEKNTATSVAAYSHFYPSGITDVFCYVDFVSCIFRDNYSVTNATVLYHGGGFYKQYNRGNQMNCLFYNNTSVNAASAIQCLNSTYDPLNNANTIGAARINVVNSTFTENTGFNSKVIKVNNGDNLATFVRNSIVYNNGSVSPFEFDGFGGGVQTQNTITTNPLFLDIANDDFRLSCNSIALDAGNNAYISPYTTDLDGLTRINNTTIDLGCYEFINAVALTAIAQDFTVELDALGNATITPAEIDNGSLTFCGGLPFTLSLDVTAFDCSDLGANTVTLTADDGVITSTATATVTVLPYAEAQNITVQLDATGNATITPSQVSAGAGACPAMIVTLDNSSFTCGDIGTNAVLLTVNDGNGNISTDYGIVTIEDNVPPVVLTQNISVAIDALTGIAVITSAMIDNGSTDNCSLTLSLSQTEFLCENQGDNTVTLTATDGEGNQATATAIVTVTTPFANFSTSVDNSTLCFGNTGTTISTVGSEAGVSYLLMDDADNVIAGPTTGTGSAMSFNTGTIAATTNYNVVAQQVYSSNGALNLDGVNDYVNMGTNNRDITSTITISARVRTYVTGGSQFIVDKYLSAGIGYYLFINATGQASIQGRDIAGGIKSSGFSTTMVADNQWHEITGVVRSDGWEIWVDGVLESSTAYSLGATGLGTTAALLAGQFNGTYTPADIDRIAIWNTALSSAQILANTTTCLEGNEANLVALFTFNETSGTTVTDYSPTAINGTLVNMTAPACWISGGLDACAVYCNTAMTPGVTVNVEDLLAPVPDLASLTDVNGSCSVSSLTAPTATDNCAGIITATHNATLPITANTSVIWTYDDGNGNTSTQTQNVVLSDATAPVADAASLSDITSECALSSLVSPTATDNCSGTISGTHNAVFPISSSTMVTWTYTDGGGNSSTQTQNIVIDDNTAPVADLASLPTLNAQCEISTLIVPTATDNCAGTITGTHNATLPITSNTTITWLYDDGQGNVSTQTQEVVLNDNTAPVADILSLPTITAQCEITSLIAPTATDNCTGAVSGTHDAVLPITANTTVTWTYDDGFGNTFTQTQSVEINDDTAPVADLTSLPTITAACEVLTLSPPTATDNCTGIITGTSDAVFPITANTTVIWTYTDGSGNSLTQTQLVEINDITIPVADISSLSTITAQCEITSLTPPTATDDCSGIITGIHNAVFPITVNTTVIWTYTDGNGNSLTQTQLVEITDNTAPVADISSLSTITAQCEITSLTAPTATDNCAGIITGTHDAVFPITANTTVTWTYTDGSGNNSTQTQLLEINDNTAPVADLTSLSTVTGSCEVLTLSPPTATDNCAGIITGTHDAVFPITANTTVIWTYTDGNGNNSTQTQLVEIIDNTAPVADITSLADVNGSCFVSSLTAPTATDDCAGIITGTHNAVFPITASTTIIWTFDDGNGNTTTQTQNVSIIDAINPVPDATSLADVNSICPITSLTAPTATDNCAGIITATSDAVFPISGVSLVTWTFMDGNGNTATQTQNVVVSDAIAPVPDAGSLANLELFCAINSLTPPTATDNCAGTLLGVHNATLPITTSGTITWTYTDAGGNATTQDQEVIITPIDVAVTQSEITLTAQNTAASAYQWIDCTNGNQVINGEINQSFTATANGSYAVVIEQGNCSDTSTCFAITTVGLDEIKSDLFIQLYPNPTTKSLTIKLNYSIESVSIYSMTGELVQTENTATFSVETLARGMYLLEIKTPNGSETVRFVKE